MKRIEILVNAFPSLSETFVMRQASGLNSRVTTGKINHELLSRISFENQVFELGGAGFRKSLFQRLGEKFLGFKDSHKFNKKLEKQLTKQWEDSKPSVVLAQFGPNGIRANQICSKLRIPFVIHFHGYDASALLRSSTYKSEILEAVNNASAIIVVSTAMQKTMIELGCPRDKLSVIPVGAPVSEFQIANAIGNTKSETQFRFLAVGRLVEKKSPLSVLKAFNKCLQVASSSRLTIIGEGPLLEEAKLYVETEGLTHSVNLLGGQPFNIVKENLLEADCFLQHSVTAKNGDQEGWPTVIAEAMACGLPVISTNHTGIIDQIDHGVSGFLVDEYDTEGMAKYMIKLAQAPPLAKQMGLAGRRRIEKIGDSKNTIAALSHVLEKNCRK